MEKVKLTGQIKLSNNLPQIIVGGKAFTWEEVGEMLGSYDRYSFNIELVSASPDNTKPVKRHRTDTQHIPPDVKEKVHKVAYYLSKFEHDGLFDEKLNQGEAIQKLADKLGVKATTLKNKRDSFDPYCSSKRIGWEKSDLALDMKEVFNVYENKSKGEILREIRSFLDKVPF